MTWAPSDNGELDRLKAVVDRIERMPSRSELALALAYVVDRYCGPELAGPLWNNAHRIRAEVDGQDLFEGMQEAASTVCHRIAQAGGGWSPEAQQAHEAWREAWIKWRESSGAQGEEP